MKRNEKNYIDKGIYSHPQIGGYLTLKQFILIEQDKKRCLLLRFVNEADFKINGARFILKQLDSDGQEIDRIDIDYNDMKLAPGQMYSPNQGIVVKKECVDFKIQMLYIASGDYRYIFENGTVTAHYDKRGYSENEKKRSRRGSMDVSIKSKYNGGEWMFGFIAVISMLLVVISFIFVLSNADNVAKDSLPESYSISYTDKI